MTATKDELRDFLPDRLKEEEDEVLKQLHTINARIGAWRTMETDSP